MCRIGLVQGTSFVCMRRHLSLCCAVVVGMRTHLEVMSPQIFLLSFVKESSSIIRIAFVVIYHLAHSCMRLNLIWSSDVEMRRTLARAVVSLFANIKLHSEQSRISFRFKVIGMGAEVDGALQVCPGIIDFFNEARSLSLHDFVI